MSLIGSLLRRFILLALAFVLVPFFMLVVMRPTLGTQGGSQMIQGPLIGGPVSPWLWVLLWFVVSVAVVAIGYFLYGAVRTTDSEADDRAVEELRIAYARGELSDEEFERRLDRLQQD